MSDDRPEHIRRAFDALHSATPFTDRVPARRPTARDAMERGECQRCGGVFTVANPAVMVTVKVDAPDRHETFDRLLCLRHATDALVAIGDALAEVVDAHPELFDEKGDR